MRRVASALLLIVVGCSPKVSGVRVGSRQVFRDSVSVAWEVRFSELDTLLTSPAKLASNDSVVAVLDMGARRVVAFSRANGRHLWTYARSGGGPGEFSNLTDIGVDGAGHFYVVDAGSGKLISMESSGSVIRETSSVEFASTRATCPMEKSRMLVFQLTVGAPLVSIDSQGRSTARIPIPWIRASTPSGSAPTSADFSDLIRKSQGVWGGDRRTTCVFAGQTSNGLALLRDGIVQWSRDVQEPVPDDSLRSASTASVSVGVRGSHVIVAFVGTGASRGKYMDLYRTSDGEYEQSWETPSGMSWVSFDSLGAVVLRLTSSGPVISSWKLGG